MQNDQSESAENSSSPSLKQKDELTQKLIELAEQARMEGRVYRKLVEEVTKGKNDSEELKITDEMKNDNR